MDGIKGVGGINAGSLPKIEDAKKAGKEFEKFLVGYMLKEVGESVSSSGMWGSGMAGGVYSGMLFDEFAGKIAEEGGLGLSEMIEEKISSDNINNTNGK